MSARLRSICLVEQETCGRIAEKDYSIRVASCCEEQTIKNEEETRHIEQEMKQLEHLEMLRDIT